MAQVVLTRALAGVVEGELEHEVAGASTVGEALEGVFGRFPVLRRYLLTDGGAVRQHVNVFLNAELVRDRVGLSDVVGEGDRVDVIQAVSGGGLRPA